MRPHALAATSMAAALLVTGVAATASAATVRDTPVNCPYVSYDPSKEDQAAYYCGLPELGPKDLPTTGPVGTLVKDYQRIPKDMTPGQFLNLYREGSSWRYPDQMGFTLNAQGKAAMTKTTMKVGDLLDRFGRIDGGYLAEAKTPYAKRSLPPDSLDPIQVNNLPEDSYRCYSVKTTFDVQQGLSAPAFGQPGMGTQMWLDPNLEPQPLKDAKKRYSVQTLIDNGYLTPEAATKCVP